MQPEAAVSKAAELINQKRVLEATDLIRRQCALEPGSAPLRFTLAHALNLAGEVTEATELYFDLFEEGYRQPAVLVALGGSLLEEGRVTEAIATFRCAIAEDPELTSARSSLLFSLCCPDNVEPAELFEEHCRFGRLFPVPSRVTAPRRPGPIRVGFLCATFLRHPVGRFSFPAVTGLDRSHFEVFCYHSGIFTDSLTTRFRQAANQWREIATLDDDQAFDVIQADDLDILIELEGHTSGNRLAVVARKPARKIVTWLGYMSTTGIPAVDYRIVDRLTDPEHFSNAFHTETLLRLGSPFIVFSPPAPSPPVSSLPAQANGYITFGAFGQVLKFSESTVSAMVKTVLALPNARLMIRALVCRDQRIKNAVVNRFVAGGLSLDRIDCSAALNNYDYLACHRDVDIMLDMFPFNGVTTTCESLWMGVPMVTRSGCSHRERVGLSLLTAAGYPELVATTIEGYVEVARSLAHDLSGLAKMRADMRAQLLASPLMDAPAFVDRFQEALLRIVQN